MTMAYVEAPWDDKTVEALNNSQKSHRMHPYTCGNHTDGKEHQLIATTQGWICPDCNYTQSWAHGFSVSVGLLGPKPASFLEDIKIDVEIDG